MLYFFASHKAITFASDLVPPWWDKKKGISCKTRAVSATVSLAEISAVVVNNDTTFFKKGRLTTIRKPGNLPDFVTSMFSEEKRLA